MTSIIIVSDIFGKTPALKTIGQTLAATAGIIGLTFIDPYNGIDHKFKTENDAYAYFINQVGHKKYQSILTDHLKACRPDTVLIGFSVGASAIWAVSEQPFPKNISKAICYYGSYIRHMPDIQPRFNIELIFPRKEPHFDVDALMLHLKDREHVTCRKTGYIHGFMNKLSVGYDPDGYTGQIKNLRTVLRRSG